MSVLVSLALGAAFVTAVIWALSKASNGDILNPSDEPADADYRLAEVIPLPCERRHRGHARNGLGTSGPAA